MKTFGKYTLLVVAMIGLCGCEDYFNPAYSGNITEETYGEKLNNLRFGLNAVFNVVQSKDYQVSELLFGEAFSDNMWTSQDVSTGAVYDVVNFLFSTDNSYILSRYEVNYQGINKANQVIRRVPTVKSKEIPATQKEIREVYGQAKVLRALFYFNLVRTYGGVSIQPEKADLGSVNVARSTEQETYAYIEKDLRESLLLLRQLRYQQSEAGQLSMGAGLGLLMKVLLYEASPGIQTSAEIKAEKLQQAKMIGEYFIDGTRDLSIREILNYDEATYGETWDQVRSRLLIDTLYNLDTKFSAANIVNQHAMMEDFDKVFHLQGEFTTENLIEINHYSFEGTGSSADEGWKLYENMLQGGSPVFGTCSQNMKTLMEKDPRLNFVICLAQNKNDYIAQEEAPDFTKGVGDGLVYCKYYVFPSEGAKEGRNYRVMRYPEVLLIYAEVLNELGETGRAVEMANKVRQRARKLFHGNVAKFINNVTESNFKDLAVGPQDVVREVIWNEKRIEMCGEWDRWYEICRLDKCSECMETQRRNLPVEGSGKTRIRGMYFKKGINERFPIPQREIFISNGVIEQNPGY